MQIDSQLLVQRVINEFEFDKVHRVLVFLDWQWAIGKNGELKVPTKVEMIQFAEKRLAEVIKKGRELGKDYSIESGGFRGSYYVNDEGEFVRLEFIVSDWTEEVYL